MISKTVILRHETHPAIALRILRTRRFVAGPILGDAGLNACIVGHPAGGYNPDQAVGRGAILEFEWNGPISTERYSAYPEPNVCYDQHPHRAFVFVGTTHHLRLVGLSLDNTDEWASHVRRPKLTLNTMMEWLRSRQESWVAEQVASINSEVEQILSTRPSVSIVLPRYAPYLSDIRKLFPDIE